MIAKLVSFGKDRSEAISRMIRAIDDYRITGVETTLSFCRFVLNHKAFVSGNFDTGFIKDHFKPEMLIHERADEAEVASVFAATLLRELGDKKHRAGDNPSKEGSAWRLNRLS